VTAQGETLRILSVEDEPLNRQLLRAVLERADDQRLREAEITEATTVAEARSRLAEAEFDLVLLDKRLPDGDGFDVCADMSPPQRTRSRVIALTADAVPATRAAAAIAGCAEVVVKPYRPGELTAAIARVLDAAP
jgi:CheY-like chemotaxis protein